MGDGVAGSDEEDSPMSMIGTTEEMSLLEV